MNKTLMGNPHSKVINSDEYGWCVLVTIFKGLIKQLVFVGEKEDCETIHKAYLSVGYKEGTDGT